MRERRWAAGVCQGLARRWDLNVVVLRKLQLSSRHELSHWASTRGLVDPGDDDAH